MRRRSFGGLHACAHGLRAKDGESLRRRMARQQDVASSVGQDKEGFHNRVSIGNRAGRRRGGSTGCSCSSIDRKRASRAAGEHRSQYAVCDRENPHAEALREKRSAGGRPIRFGIWRRSLTVPATRWFGPTHGLKSITSRNRPSTARRKEGPTCAKRIQLLWVFAWPRTRNATDGGISDRLARVFCAGLFLPCTRLLNPNGTRSFLRGADYRNPFAWQVARCGRKLELLRAGALRTDPNQIASKIECYDGLLVFGAPRFVHRSFRIVDRLTRRWNIIPFCIQRRFSPFASTAGGPANNSGPSAPPLKEQSQ